MRAMHATLKSFTLLVFLAAVTRASEADDLQASINCALDAAKPGGTPQAMFSGPGGACQCKPTASTDSGWTKCPSAGALENGVAVCVTGIGCSKECFQNAILEDGECKPYPIAPSAGMVTLTDKDCKAGTNKVIGAYEGDSCKCQTATWHKASGGKVCQEGIPENSFATCLRSELKVGDSYCSFQCKPGFAPSADLKSCVGENTKPDPAKNDPSKEDGGKDLAPACPDPMIVSYASAAGPCGCAPSLKLAKKRKPDAVQCIAPANHGKLACKNVGSGSKCSVDCETGFKPSDEEKDCIPARKNETKSELDCGADAGGVGFLSADPVKGCICETEIKDTFCGVAFGDDDAEMMCSDTTDLKGTREVKCAVKCSDGFTAKDKDTCEKVEVEGDSVTMAGTAKPRDSEEVACSEKVFRLPGQGGCKCAPALPTGATECPGVGPKEYAICQYEKGSGEEASCTTECIKGAYKKGPSNLCS
ncbi:hypothetical protein B0H13DRAFT_2329407 [Mycena leptocephala]|nr:hypothetical protein B0H13DRAFT_2329407 [Mycena leptocephala]